MSHCQAKTLFSAPEHLGPAKRCGATLVEVIVAFALLGTALGIVTPLLVSNHRLLAAQRDDQLALNEVSNQLERLTALSASERQAAVEELQPSEFAAEHLEGVELHGELTDEEHGQRLTLRLTWNQTSGRSAPTTLTAWIYREPSAAAAREESP